MFIEGYGLLFAYPCQRVMILGDIVTWRIQPMGDLSCYNGFFNLTRYYDYNEVCLKLRKEEIEAIFCKPQDPATRYNTKKHFKTILLGVLCFASAIFFLITLLVYACLPFLQNLHGKILMCHVFSLGMAFFTSANIKLNPMANPRMTFESYYLRKILGMK